MATDVQIANLALLRIGSKALVATMADTTTEGVVLAASYSLVRNALLAHAWWPWATRRAALSLAAGVSRSGWQYAYALPADCLQPQYLYPGARTLGSGHARMPYQLEASGSGASTVAVLLTDVKDAELVYTALVHEAAFPAAFVNALAWALAAELTLSLAVQPTVAERAAVQARLALAEALRAAEAAQQPDAPVDGEYIRARG